MQPQSWQLTVPDDFRKPLANAWMQAAVIALLLSGVFVILIVASRTPGVSSLFPYENFFHLAIVAHVDFSVLVWFGAFSAILWTLASRPLAAIAGWGSLIVMAMGSLMLAIAPFQQGQAIMSNYVPVLDNALFLGGLAVFGLGLLISAMRSMVNPLPASGQPAEEGVMRFGVHTGVIALVLSFGALIWSFLAMPEYLFGPQYYEVLFWGGGHILQFAWVQFMLVAWLWLASSSGIRIPLSPRLVMAFLLAGVIPAFLAVWGYLYFEVGSPGHRTFFIWLMAAGGGLASGPIGLALLIGWWKSEPAKNMTESALRAGLIFSIALFGFGGALGFLITDSNTMVPAHYHGCIVAITLTFMMLALHLLPKFGFRSASLKMMLALPWIYGTGQFLHVIGLAFSGGHGVQRKTAGADQMLETIAQLGGMIVMGIGGLVAIIGGVLFLVAFGQAVLTRRRPVLAGAT